MNDDRTRYNQYVENINKMLKSEQFYDAFQKKLRAARPSIKLERKKRTKTFDLEWIDMVEKSLINLDNIVRNPRKFIVQEEDIVDISLARSISTESVKHLAQHTNFISSVDKDGMVTPNKILNVTKEESFEVYENRFIYTLLRNLNNFITRRMDAIKASYVNDNVIELDVDSSVFTGKTRVFYKLELIGSMPTEDLSEVKDEDISVVERIAKIQKVLGGFMGSPFAKQMVSSAPVRPPITRTNVILKNPDFKQALILWQFVEGYTKMGFTVENDVKKVPMDEVMSTSVNDMILLGSLLMDGLIEGKAEDSAFFNESIMDEKDKIEAEKEAQKEEEKKEEEKKEEEKPEEVKEETKSEEKEKEPEVEEAYDQNVLPDDDTKLDDENEPDEDESDYIEEVGNIDETRNMFQRTNEETTLTKAEMTRINKAIDRVLEREKIYNAKMVTEELAQVEETDPEKIKAQLEKEKAMVQKAMERRAEAIEREKIAAEKAAAREKERLQKLEEKLKEKTLAPSTEEKVEETVDSEKTDNMIDNALVEKTTDDVVVLKEEKQVENSIHDDNNDINGNDSIENSTDTIEKVEDVKSEEVEEVVVKEEESNKDIQEDNSESDTNVENNETNAGDVIDD